MDPRAWGLEITLNSRNPTTSMAKSSQTGSLKYGVNLYLLNEFGEDTTKDSGTDLVGI